MDIFSYICMLRISIADMHCMFLHRSTPSANADKALLKDECSEFNNLQIIAHAALHRGVPAFACVGRRNASEIVVSFLRDNEVDS